MIYSFYSLSHKIRFVSAMFHSCHSLDHVIMFLGWIDTNCLP